MTYTDDMPPPSASATAHGSPWEPCDHCQAPLAEHQRYCVSCGARRAQADDPVARYFVTAARRARASEAAPAASAAAGSGSSNLRAAIVFALLPLAAAAGVMVGRGSGGDNQQLIDALRAQKAPVVNVVGGGGSLDTTSDGGSGSNEKVVDDNPNDANGKVIARTEYGTARQLTGAKPNAAQLEESRQALKHIVESKGKEYVEQQRNLPDQIVIP